MRPSGFPKSYTKPGFTDATITAVGHSIRNPVKRPVCVHLVRSTRWERRPAARSVRQIAHRQRARSRARRVTLTTRRSREPRCVSLVRLEKARRGEGRVFRVQQTALKLEHPLSVCVWRGITGTESQRSAHSAPAAPSKPTAETRRAWSVRRASMAPLCLPLSCAFSVPMGTRRC